MSFFEQPALSAVITVYSFALAVFCLYGLARAIGETLSKRAIAAYALLFLTCAVCVHLADGVRFAQAAGIEPDRVSRFLMSLPPYVPTAVLAALMVLSILFLWRLQRHIASSLTASSVQEGFDAMPDGVCFSNGAGTPLLVNRCMQSISLAAFGTGILDADAIRRRLVRGEVLDACRVERHGDEIFLHLPDGRVFSMRRSLTKAGNAQVQEDIAYDITELYEKSREMETRNRRLRAVNARMRQYSRDLDAITRQQELLAAKIRVHDDIGRCLLALRAYLAQEDGEREKLVSLWRFTIAVLRREAQATDADDRMEALRQAAEAVDIRLVFDGEIPRGGQAEEVAAKAIHECLTNAVKHAHADVLTVKTRQLGGYLNLTLTNNGEQPTAPIEEKGGLRTLREFAEKHGGIMELDYAPRFALRIKIRKDGVERWEKPE